MNFVFDVYELHRELVAAAAPSGFEQPMAELLSRLAAPFVDTVEIDEMHNVICHKKGEGKKIMLAAHLDVIGMLVTHVDAQGYIQFDRCGWLDAAELVNTRVRFPSGVHGIVRLRDAAKAQGKPASELRMTDFYIDIGAKDKADAEQYVRLGDTAVFEGAPRKIGGDKVMGPYADDLVSCVVLLRMLEQLGDCPNDVYAVFTAQEEVGCRGAQVAAAGIQPDIGVAVDVCDTGDKPEDHQVVMEVACGKGPTVKIRDSAAIASPELNARLRALAEAQGIPYQNEILRAGGTDTGAMQRSGAHVCATCVSIPTRHIHAPGEVYSIADVENAAKLLAALVMQKQ